VNRLSSLVLVLVALLVARNAAAFDVQTHALMTREAYQRSILANESENGVLPRLGLDRLKESNRFSIYWVTEPQTYVFPKPESFYYRDGGLEGNPFYSVNRPEQFERCQMQAFLIAKGDSRRAFRDLFRDTVDPLYPLAHPERLPIQNWLLRGAIREDDMGDGVGLAGLLGGDCSLDWALTVPWQPGRITRSYRHFFDPEFNKGLNVLGDDYPKAVDWALGYQDSFANPAMPAEGINRNPYSYLDARNAFWWALTRKTSKDHGLADSAVSREIDAEDRMILWATLFRSLGNVVHLLQDTAQPQHSRIDPHSPKDSAEQQAFEGYTNARVLGGGKVGYFLRGFFSAPIDAENLTVPPLGSYGMIESNTQQAPISFATPLRFFTTRKWIEGDAPGYLDRKGLADYSARGFFTGGTMPGIEGSHPHQSPPSDLLDPSYSISFSPCEAIFEVDSRITNVVCRHFLHDVRDVVSPGYAASIDQLPPGFTLPFAPVAADGIFRRFMSEHGASYFFDIPKVTWSPAVIDTIGNLTIPRAIAYSTGLLDFFFRGEIELTLPPEGVYAVVDQGTPHHVQDGIPMDEEGRVFGFKKLRVGIRNVTNVNENGISTFKDAGSGTMVSQTMRSGIDASGNPTGKLVAIARYHRNPCYQPDLSGEYVTMPDPVTGIPDQQNRRVPNGCLREATRTAFQEISVSAPMLLDSAGNLPGQSQGATNPCVNVGNINAGAHGVGSDCESESVLAQFDFSEDPIPINATDLFIQVAYRGPLGLEDDGIAVGVTDVHEASFISMWNGTDWFNLDGYWVSPDQVGQLPSPYQWLPSPVDVMYTCIGEQTIARLYPEYPILPRDFFRIAVLSNIVGDDVSVPISIYAQVGRYGHTTDFFLRPLARQMSIEDASRLPGSPYSPTAIPWYARGTVLGGVGLGAFFSYGIEEVDRSAEALILEPAIGRTAPGIPAQVNAGFEVSADACQRAPDLAE